MTGKSKCSFILEGVRAVTGSWHTSKDIEVHPASSTVQSCAGEESLTQMK